MIFRKIKNVNDIEKIKKIINNIAKQTTPMIDIEYNYKSINSCFGQKDNQKYYIQVGVGFDNKINFELKVVTSIISFYHEYRHFMQYTQGSTPEINVSIVLGNANIEFWKAKYSMLPQEFDAEIYSIEQSKKYIEEYFPNINFKEIVLQYVNNTEKWLGPYPEQHNRPQFNSYEQVIGYLKYYQKEAYTYPTEFFYQFQNQQESSNLAYMKNGAEQQYILAKELYKKGLVDEDIVKITKYLIDYYKENNIFYKKEKEESIEDIYLNLPKENSATTNTFLMENKEIDNETIDTQRNL